MTTTANTNRIDTTERTVGELFDANLDIVQIAKLIRKALKGAGFKASVRVQRYSMGRSVNITVSAVVSDYLKRQIARAAMEQRDEIALIPNAMDFAGCYRSQVERMVREIASAWNRTERDSYTDYYSTNYHISACFEG